ncbi:hypothetical protein D3C81_1383860 [compost metagenome]
MDGGVIHVFGVHGLDQAVAIAHLQLLEDVAVLGVELRFGGLVAGVESENEARFREPVLEFAQGFFGDQRRDLA